MKAIRGTIGWLAGPLSLLLIPALLVGCLGFLHPAFDSVGHFRMPIGVLVVLLLPLLLIGRWKKTFRVGIFSVFLALVLSAPFLPGMRTPSATIEGKPYTLLQFNLNIKNQDPDALLQLVDRFKPDFLTIQERSFVWKDHLAKLKAKFPYSHACEQPAAIDSLIYSRYPLVSADACIGPRGLAVATFDLDGKEIQIASFHADWPWPFDQAWQMKQIGPTFDRMKHARIIAGDFNAVPWSAFVRGIARRSKTYPVRGYRPTWLPRLGELRITIQGLPNNKVVWQKLGFAGLPIDHVLTSDDIIVQDIRTLDEIGSDHLPVLMTFKMQ